MIGQTTAKAEVIKRSRIMFFINSLTSGGAERVTAQLASYLARADHDVTVVTMHGTERDFYELDPRVSRVGLSLAYRNRGLQKVFATFIRIRALRTVFKQHRPHVVVGMMSGSAVFALLAAVGLNVRVITAERNYPPLKKLPFPWNVFRKLFYRFAHGHVAQTRETAEWLSAHCAARNVTVIPNSVTLPLPRIQPELLPESILAPDDRIILGVGSLSTQKGFDLLIQAFSRIAPVLPKWKLVIIGGPGTKDQDGDQRSSLEALVRDYRLSDRVLMPGLAGNIGDWYQRADIFVLSSRYEGFPNVLLEAMAFGCACVAFDCKTGPREIITNNETGMLIAPESVGKLAVAIESLVVDEPLKTRLGQAAVSVAKNFSEDRVAELWMHYIDFGRPFTA